MSNGNNIWTTSNILGFGLACLALALLFALCIYRIVKITRGKRHLGKISNSNADIIREHMIKFQINGARQKTWIELSELCFAVLDDYCRDEEEVAWIMHKKVWPIIDDMAYQDQRQAISDLKVLGGSLESRVFPFEKEKWHKAFIKAKKYMM